MSIPRVVKVGPFDYTVDVVANLQDDAESRGITHPRTQSIRIDSQVPAQQRREVLLHEALHAVWDLVDLKTDFPDSEGEPGERIIQRLAPQLVDLFRRNPRLVAFLTE